MTKQEEITSLVKVIREHDYQPARERLYGLIENFIRDMAKKYSNDLVSVEELVGAGWDGVNTAIERWDENRESFLTYARWWIMDALDKERMAHSDLISVPLILRKHVMRHLNDASTEKPAHFAEAVAALSASRTEDRIGNERDVDVRGSGEANAEGWYPKDEKAMDEEKMSLALDVEGFINRLDALEGKIFRMHYGFNDEQVEYSNKEIAKTLGLTAARVKSILDKSVLSARECLAGYEIK